MLKVRRYEASDYERWNRFVLGAKNGTFLFDRRYMNYHSDRFTDHSLLFFLDEVLLAILPASQHDKEIRSHGGLTYGGILTDHRMSVLQMLDLFCLMAGYYYDLGFERMRYSPTPHIYHKLPAEEDLYALYLSKAKLVSRGPSAALDLLISDMPGKKYNGAKKAERLGLVVQKVNDPRQLMVEIDLNLQSRHQVMATHSSEEMYNLSNHFPSQIEIFHVVDVHDNLLGGAIVYLTKTTAHVQYMLVNELGRPLRAMDLLISELIKQYRNKYYWLEFGVSTEKQGLILNTSLMHQKEGFGASAVCYDVYLFTFKNSLSFAKSILT